MADSAAPTALVAGPSDEHKLSDEDKRTFPLEDGMTNCGGRGLMAGLLGFPMAMFFSFLSISPDPNTAPAVPGQPEASLWKRNVEVLKHTGVRGWQSGKNFFWLGLVWSGSECLIEKARGKSDMMNAVYAGVGTGVLLSWRGGLGASITSAALFTVLAYGGEMAFGKSSHRPSDLFGSHG